MISAKHYRIAKLQTALDIRWLFRGDAIISPSIYTVVLFPFTFIVYLIFYRKECSLWPMLLFLCTGAINIFSAPYIDDTAFLVLYALITFVEIVWLIVAMVKYPKQQKAAWASFKSIWLVGRMWHILPIYGFYNNFLINYKFFVEFLYIIAIIGMEYIS